MRRSARQCTGSSAATSYPLILPYYLLLLSLNEMTRTNSPVLTQSPLTVYSQDRVQDGDRGEVRGAVRDRVHHRLQQGVQHCLRYQGKPSE